MRAFFFSFFVTLATLAVACTECLPINSPVSTPKQQWQGTVTISSTCAPKGGIGTGFVISKSRVITAAHVVPGCPEGKQIVGVDPGDGDVRDAEVAIVFPSLDIAVLEVDADLSQWLTPVTYGPVPDIGETVCWSVAYPTPSRRCGPVGPSRDSSRVWFSGTVEHGNSGAPVFDNLGRLVGLAVATHTCQDDSYCQGIFTPIQPIRKFPLTE